MSCREKGVLAPFFSVKCSTVKPILEHLQFCGCYTAHWLKTRECPCSRFPLPEVGCAASVSLQAQGKCCTEITAAAPISNRRCVLVNVSPHCVSFVFSRAVHVTLFSYWREKKGFFKELHIQVVCVSKEQKGCYLQEILQFATVCFIYSSATVISILTTRAEGSENGTGEKTAVFVLKKPLWKEYLFHTAVPAWKLAGLLLPSEQGFTAVLFGAGLLPN